METDSILISIAMLKEVIAGKTYDAVAAQHGVTRTTIERRIKTVALKLSREVGIEGLNEQGLAFVQRLRACKSAITAALEQYEPQISQDHGVEIESQEVAEAESGNREEHSDDAEARDE